MPLAGFSVPLEGAGGALPLSSYPRVRVMGYGLYLGCVNLNQIRLDRPPPSACRMGEGRPEVVLLGVLDDEVQ